MTDSRDATPLPNRRTVLIASVLPLAPGPSAVQGARGDQAIFNLIDAIGELRRQSRAAQSRAEMRRLALEAAGRADGVEHGDPEWLREIRLSDMIDATVSDHADALERIPAAGLAGVIAKLEFAVAEEDAAPMVASALEDLRRIAVSSKG
ncbi:hypothetical protein [Azospirillum picis]|uniref:Uncharacterized protein n=1 Tax=Azospirillum picis TaxID=488438 RepID=A0ABU0MUX1_9PROT|nr:hypothetical protein [Azospirillum picis]MBP2303445.1 hypothetical protein [Azospirillum picis]MDQ0537296.1 hypothetical protein [Azospirillum picis]